MSKPEVPADDQAPPTVRAAELRQLLAHHAHRYYVLDDPQLPNLRFLFS